MEKRQYRIAFNSRNVADFICNKTCRQKGSSPETRFSFLKHFRIFNHSYQTRFKSIKGIATTDTVKI